MGVKQVVPGVHRVPLGMVNSFIVERDDGRISLVDAGMAAHGGRILAAVAEIGRRPADIDEILVTHAHADHVGGVPAVAAAGGAAVRMHAEDADMAAVGRSHREWHPAPGLFNRLLYRAVLRGYDDRMDPVTADTTVADGDVLPSGFRVIATPGHTIGHVCYLWPAEGGVLFAGDAASHFGPLRLTVNYEDVEEGRRSLARLGDLDFQVVCFAHGRPIVGGAAARFRRSFGSRPGPDRKVTHGR
jgi:glyoxylase-like metal-dependent hydrolase (beta-lactamase superfamily II)